MTPIGRTYAIARWRRQLHAAVRLNAADAGLMTLADESPSDVAAAMRAAQLVRALLPYRFDGARHRILELSAARRRGWGACGDAVAAIAAVLLARGRTATVCYEQSEAVTGYAHVRIAIGRVFADAFPEASIEVPCSATLSLTRGSVRWPVPASSAQRR